MESLLIICSYLTTNMLITAFTRRRFKIEEGKYELKSAQLEKEGTLKTSNHEGEMTPRRHDRRKEAQSQDPATLRTAPSFSTGAIF
jgi:hypothetical protein